MTDTHLKIGILLAAGASTRMQGVDKLMQDVYGQPMIRHAARQMCDSGVDQVLVAIAADREDHKAALQDLDVTCVSVADALDGMGVSLRTAVAAAPSAVCYVIGLCDMPDIMPSHIQHVIAAHDPVHDALIVVPQNRAGQKGHPVLFDGRFRSALMTCSGDIGAKHILQQNQNVVVRVTLDDAVTRDLDTQEAWDEWQKSNYQG